ncbi:NAD(P)-binding protein [Mycena filopes]|nr:NAD(P)-binding protein [Mycena filopes]
MSTYKSFAVVGAGTIGLPIATGLAAKGLSVLILSRGSTKTAPPGVQLVQVDTSDVAAVTAVLKEHKVDVVISTIKAHGEGGAAAQMPVVDAAKAAAVKLYAPSEFGSPTDGYTEGFLAPKNKLAEYAKSVGLPTVRIYGERATLKELATKFNTTAEQVESIAGPEGAFLTGMLAMFEKGAGSTGWDETNGREGSGDHAAGSANALWSGHHWQTIKEVHKV